MDVKIRKSRKADKPSADKTPLPMPTRHEVDHPLYDLRRGVDALFDDFFSGFALHPFRWDPFGLEPFRRAGRSLAPFGEMSPHVDVSETDKAYTVTAELPGLGEDDIEVTLSEGRLTISGEKREEKEEKERDFHLTERRYGSFRRTLRLPESLDADKVSARFDKGVLRIELPKIENTATAPRKIKVSAD